MRRKPATSKTFIDHLPYQVLSLKEPNRLPAKFWELARTFTCFDNVTIATEKAELRAKLNPGVRFAVVNRISGEIVTSYIFAPEA